MPQPLSRVAPNAGVAIGNAGDRPLLRHPDLAVLAIESIASWSNVEAFLLNLFVELFGGRGSLAANVYLSLDGQSAKNAAIDAAATSVLGDSPDKLRVLKAILAIAKTNKKDRDKLAHWVWGDSAIITDAVLLTDPRISTDSVDLSKIFVYRAVDFNSIIQSNDRLCGYGLNFIFILNDHPSNEDDKLLKQLIAEPAIKARLSGDGKSNS